MKHVLSTGEDAKQEDQKNEEWVLFQDEKNGKEEGWKFDTCISS
jgi:hypothetical protein